MQLKVRRLEPSDDRTRFRSGNIELDLFFLRYAGQNQFRHHVGTTYVAVDDGDTIYGFATVTASELSTTRLPAAKRKRLPQYPLPVLRLARLAVHERMQGRGVGRVLLQFVFALANRMAEDFGCIGVIVDAKPDAVAFYQKLGFVALDISVGQMGDRPLPLPMLLDLGSIPLPSET